MKVLQINNFHYQKGGSERAYFNTGELLQDHGHEVFYFSLARNQNLHYKYSNYFPQEISYRQLSLLGKITHSPDFIFNKEAYRKIIKYIDVIRPDIAHLHLFLGGLTTSILVALKKRGIPVVCTVHDYRLICPAYLFLDGNNRICGRCRNKFYFHCTLNQCSEKRFSQSLILTMEAYYRKYFIDPLKYINKFIFVSEFSRSKHIQFNSDYKYNSDLLYNYVSKDAISSDNKKGDYFIYFGRLSREKGIQTLIKSFENSNLKLKIVGTGPLIKDFNKQYYNIEFLGYKNGDELYNLINNSSFAIIPSEWYENNPFAILESYSQGKPVIGANIGGIPEIIMKGQTGFLFESGNALELIEVLKQADELSISQYKMMSINAKRFADIYFSSENYYKKLLSIYQSVIS